VTLRAKLDTKNRGDRITAQEIREATGLTDWQSFRSRIATWAKRAGYELEAVRNDGWRIVLPHEHMHVAEQKRRKALRQELRCFRALATTPTGELNDRQMRQHQAALVLSQARQQVALQHDQELLPRAAEDRPPLRLAGN
jgi:hypothetical protein